MLTVVSSRFDDANLQEGRDDSTAVDNKRAEKDAKALFEVRVT